MFGQANFYKNSNVRQRISEYCGGVEGDFSAFTAEYLVGYGEFLRQEGLSPEGFLSTSKNGFFWILKNGLDIFRSIWDRQSILSIFDIEYFNLDFPGEPYLYPQETFQKLEPVYNAVLTVFYRFNIIPLVVITGRGYHFTSRVALGTETEKKLEKIGRIEDTLAGKYATSSGRRHRSVPFSHGRVFDGMGRLMEYLAHLVMKEVRGKTSIPVVCTEVACQQGKKGREAISLDLSMYGDPIYLRDIRCPFSSYQKHKVERYKVGDKVSERTPVIVALPRGGLDSLPKLLEIRQNFHQAIECATTSTTEIPDQSKGFENLIRSYIRSRLYRFHKYFDSEEHNPYWDWGKTYDHFDLHNLPPCVSHALRVPNEHLLKPTNLQILTKVLSGMDWHPKHISGLIRSKFERDYGWGNFWLKYDAATRADFYVRTFAGLLCDKSLDGDELNCLSHRRKGYCWRPDCGFNL
jgi:hypothetical protein